MQSSKTVNDDLGQEFGHVYMSKALIDEVDLTSLDDPADDHTHVGQEPSQEVTRRPTGVFTFTCIVTLVDSQEHTGSILSFCRSGNKRTVSAAFESRAADDICCATVISGIKIISRHATTVWDVQFDESNVDDLPLLQYDRQGGVDVITLSFDINDDVGDVNVDADI